MKSGPTVYAVISQHLLEMISERDPKILFANIPDNRNTSQFIEYLDMCIDWQQLSCGEVIDIDEGETKFIVKVLHGRVREFIGSGIELERHQRELGSGSFLGEFGIFSKIMNKPYFYTIRQTEITTFPVELIEGLVTSSSQVATSFLPKLLARQKGGLTSSTSDEDSCGQVDPIKTICLLPVGVDFRTPRGANTTIIRDNQTRLTEGIAEGLEQILQRHKTSFTVIDGVRASELMGRQLFTTLGTLKMNEFLSSQEDVTDVIIYVADGIFSNWTGQCISQVSSRFRFNINTCSNLFSC